MGTLANPRSEESTHRGAVVTTSQVDESADRGAVWSGAVTESPVASGLIDFTHLPVLDDARIDWMRNELAERGTQDLITLDDPVVRGIKTLHRLGYISLDAFELALSQEHRHSALRDCFNTGMARLSDWFEQQVGCETIGGLYQFLGLRMDDQGRLSLDLDEMVGFDLHHLPSQPRDIILMVNQCSMLSASYLIPHVTLIDHDFGLWFDEEAREEYEGFASHFNERRPEQLAAKLMEHPDLLGKSWCFQGVYDVNDLACALDRVRPHATFNAAHIGSYRRNGHLHRLTQQVRLCERRYPDNRWVAYAKEVLAILRTLPTNQSIPELLDESMNGEYYMGQFILHYYMRPYIDDTLMPLNEEFHNVGDGTMFLFDLDKVAVEQVHEILRRSAKGLYCLTQSVVVDQSYDPRQ